MLKTLTCSLLVISGFALAAENGQELRIYPGVAPGSEGKTGEEKSVPPAANRGYTMLSGVHKPSVTVFLPPADKATGTGVIILPGGGHQFLAIDIEGVNVAKYYNSIGVAAFVLKYRLAREEGSTYQIEREALQDAQRAVRFVRSKAKEFGINPNRLGIMGFSTGGQLAAMESHRFDAGNKDATDEVERVSSRPDFTVLIYPANVRTVGEIAKDAPPAFLLCTYSDNNPATQVPEFFLALKKAGIPAELHVYSSGPHGFGLREKPQGPFPSTSTWQFRVADWMGDRGLLKKD